MNQLSASAQPETNRRLRPINPIGITQLAVGILLIGSAAACFNLLPAAACLVGIAGLGVATAGSQQLFTNAD